MNEQAFTNMADMTTYNNDYSFVNCMNTLFSLSCLPIGKQPSVKSKDAESQQPPIQKSIIDYFGR